MHPISPTIGKKRRLTLVDVGDPVFSTWQAWRRRYAGTQLKQPVHVGSTVKALATDALPEASEQAATHVGVQSRRLDAQHGARLGRAEELLTVKVGHSDDYTAVSRRQCQSICMQYHAV